MYTPKGYIAPLDQKVTEQAANVSKIMGQMNDFKLGQDAILEQVSQLPQLQMQTSHLCSGPPRDQHTHMSRTRTQYDTQRNAEHEHKLSHEGDTTSPSQAYV